MTEIKEEMSFPIQYTAPFEIEETRDDGIFINGTLLAEGLSKNGNLYTLDEMESIAKSAEGVPIRYGVTTDIDPNTGMLARNVHDKSDENIIGKIVKTVLDPVKRIIKYWAVLWNSIKFPNITETVKKGWGVSIGGWAKKGVWILDKIGRAVLRIIGLKVNHVQLLSPEVKRGQDEAKVESVGDDARFVQESFIAPIEQPTRQEIARAVVLHAIRINLVIED